MYAVGELREHINVQISIQIVEAIASLMLILVRGQFTTRADEPHTKVFRNARRETEGYGAVIAIVQVLMRGSRVSARIWCQCREKVGH